LFFLIGRNFQFPLCGNDRLKAFIVKTTIFSGIIMKKKVNDQNGFLKEGNKVKGSIM